MRVYINTCLFKSGELSKIGEYIDRYGDSVGFEILSKFDEPTFGAELEGCVPLAARTRIRFHSPVWLAEPSAAKGTAAYEETMRMNRLTAEYARRMGCESVTLHLNNCAVKDGCREEVLRNALDNLVEFREMYSFTRVFVENAGTPFQRSALLSQEAFTALCRREGWDVLIDLGHANACGWNLYRLLDELGDQICAFHIHNNDGVRDLHARIGDGTLDVPAFLRAAKRVVPAAAWILEYISPDKEGLPLREDFETLLRLREE